MIQGDQPIAGSPPAPTIPAEQLASAIAQTRHVFESEPAAGDVLEYLKAVLDSAPGAAPLESSTQNCADDLRAVAAEGWSDLYRKAAQDALAVAEQETRRADITRAAYERIRAVYLDLARRYDKLEATNANLVAQLAAVRAAAPAPGWCVGITVHLDLQRRYDELAAERDQLAARLEVSRAECIDADQRYSALARRVIGGATTSAAGKPHTAAGAAPVVGGAYRYSWTFPSSFVLKPKAAS